MSGPPEAVDIRWWDNDAGGPLAPTTAFTPKGIAVKDNLLLVLQRLTERDRRICRVLFDHKVLNIHQIHELFFDNPRRTRRRMLELFHMGLVLRFRPYQQTGSAPYHYVIGKLGLELIAAERSIEDKKLRIRYDRINKLAKSQRLRHQLEVNSFFTRLTHACRNRVDVQLTEWRNEEHSGATTGWHFRPDGYGALRSTSGATRFYLEVDRGTEDLSRLRFKFERYVELRSWDTGPWLVLFVFPSSRRETSARKVFSPSGITIATSTRELVHRHPLEATWLPIGAGDRVSLADLAEGAGIVGSGTAEP